MPLKTACGNARVFFRAEGYSFLKHFALFIFNSSAQIKISITLFSQVFSSNSVTIDKSFEIAFNDLGSFLRLFSPSFLIATVRPNQIASGLLSIAGLVQSVISLCIDCLSKVFDG